MLVLPFVASASAVAEMPVFAAPKVVATAQGVGGMSEQEVGDVNADGITDLVVTRLAFPIAHATFPIGIFLGDGNGGLRDGSSLFAGPAPRTQHGRQIVIADFNGDRRNDIFVADHGYDAEPFPGHPNTLVLSTPDGKLVDASSNLPPESAFSHSAAAADIDRDGDVDVYVGNLCCADHTPAEILLNDGTGHFARGVGLLPPEQADPLVNRYTRSLFVDANVDGAPDLVLGAENNTLSSAVLLNDGTGRFHSVPNALPPKAFGPRSITISLATLDANRDGKPDLVAGFQREDFSGRLLQLLIGNGDGTFRDETAARIPVQDEGNAWPYAIRVADVNRDGHTDFGVSVSISNERPAMYVDDGAGVFRMSKLASTSPVFSFADVNRDGRVDLLGSYSGGNEGTEQHEVQVQRVAPAAPRRVRATSTRHASIRVVWTAVSGAERYEIWRSAGAGRRTRIAVAERSPHVDRNAKRRVTYRYWVRAGNAVAMSAFAGPAVARRP
jgi:hypothetical protein